MYICMYVTWVWLYYPTFHNTAVCSEHTMYICMHGSIMYVLVMSRPLGMLPQ